MLVEREECGEGPRIELEPSSFEQGFLKVCTCPIFNRFYLYFFLLPVTPSLKRQIECQGELTLVLHCRNEIHVFNISSP